MDGISWLDDGRANSLGGIPLQDEGQVVLVQRPGSDKEGLWQVEIGDTGEACRTDVCDTEEDWTAGAPAWGAEAAKVHEGAASSGSSGGSDASAGSRSSGSDGGAGSRSGDADGAGSRSNGADGAGSRSSSSDDSAGSRSSCSDGGDCRSSSGGGGRWLTSRKGAETPNWETGAQETLCK